MKTRLIRCLLVGFIASFTALNVSAATRICSVYMESYSALQKQVYLAAEIFQAPQLGAVPMMLPAVLPGADQMDNNKPVALHFLDVGGEKPGVVIEVTPSGTAMAYLQALAGADVKLPVPTDGIYKLGDGTSVRIVGNRVLLAPQAKDAAACLGKAVDSLPAMPDVTGVIRVSIAPAALKPMMEKVKQTLEDMPTTGMANADQGRQTLESVLEFYNLLLGQINAIDMGINIQNEGIFIRTRLVPKPGSEIAAMVASTKPIPAAQLAFIEKDSLFSFAAGSYTFPASLKQQVINLYVKMLGTTPIFQTADTNEFAAIMNQSVKAIGAPMAFTGNLPTDGKSLLMQGTMGVPNPIDYLNEQLAMMKTPSYKALMTQSGMEIPEPVKRTYKDFTVYSFKMLFDDKAMDKMMRDSMPTNLPPEVMEEAAKSGAESMSAIMKLFGNGYEYAANSKNLFFGMGSSAMVEQAIARGQATGVVVPEVDRIRKLLAPAAEPCMLGRFSVTGLFKLGMSFQPALAGSLNKNTQALPQGEGVVFAEWVSKGEAFSALLIPTSEIKAIKAQIESLKSQAMPRAPMGAVEQDEDTVEKVK